ncbi:MAG TPA: hypothetical protein VF778_02855, partial [Xanthobacteraceae bacterium]
MTIRSFSLWAVTIAAVAMPLAPRLACAQAQAAEQAGAKISAQAPAPTEAQAPAPSQPQDPTPIQTQVPAEPQAPVPQPTQAAGPQADTNCPGNPDALGTSRVLSLDPTQYPRVGHMQYPDSLPLNDKEVVLTFD